MRSRSTFAPPSGLTRTPELALPNIAPPILNAGPSTTCSALIHVLGCGSAHRFFLLLKTCRERSDARSAPTSHQLWIPSRVPITSETRSSVNQRSARFFNPFVCPDDR
ncbi:hypothetical protein P691DRAFT_482476 [Macrolepiota fuliginosa MF-IS2]|uniref:Uncharacterized protein n=1 Tax=Macrolepiota fuliginosa MF-IS2 TaxID=1400762 RepID=A0A9P5XH90_9AGAR|nr:hypothetical protein P691DRAFT_482458 [Macrolepiota fuliginosa MF-IS2]KAF9450254.1 hypothetical protein P691DRAFT_482476 [Macrolepiota fuliginosa MF-IS2]